MILSSIREICRKNHLTIRVKLGRIGISGKLVFELFFTSDVQQKDNGIGLKKWLPVSRCFCGENGDILGRD